MVKNAFSKGLMVFQQHNFQSRHDIRTKSKASVLVFFLVWNKIKRLFSKARRFHLMRSWKTAACLLQAAEISEHYPSSRIRGECYRKRCSKILRRKGLGETLGETWMMESQDTRGFGLSKISKCLADMTCKTTVPPKSLLKESVPRWSSRYARSGEAGQGELWPWQKKGEWISVQALTTNPPPWKKGNPTTNNTWLLEDVSSLKYPVEKFLYPVFSFCFDTGACWVWLVVFHFFIRLSHFYLVRTTWRWSSSWKAADFAHQLQGGRFNELPMKVLLKHVAVFGMKPTLNVGMASCSTSTILYACMDVFQNTCQLL